jgi:hypothetical protein
MSYSLWASFYPGMEYDEGKKERKRTGKKLLSTEEEMLVRHTPREIVAKNKLSVL